MQPQQNPYSFIMQDPQQRFSGGTPGSKLKRLAVIVTMVFIIGILIIVGLYLLGAGGRKTNAQIQELFAYQNELMRVAELGEKNALGTETKGFAITSRLTIDSDQKILGVIAQKKGVDTDEKVVAAAYNVKGKTTDAELDAAAKNNRYDETFITIYSDILGTYQKKLQTLYKATSSKKDQGIYESLFNNAATLIGTKEPSTL